jgi:hypothetical protein
VNNKDAREKLLAWVRNLFRNVLASFRGTEADACALVAAYGLYAFELERLQDNRSVEQKASSPKSFGSTHSKWNGSSIGPIPIGVHPDRIESVLAKARGFEHLITRRSYEVAVRTAITANGTRTRPVS